MDRDALHVTPGDFNLASMKPTSDLNIERTHCFDNSTRAAHGTGWTVERREKSISQRFHFFSATAREFAAHNCMMSVKQITPALVAYLFGLRSGAHNVCEQNSCQDSIALWR